MINSKFRREEEKFGNGYEKNGHFAKILQQNREGMILKLEPIVQPVNTIAFRLSSKKFTDEYEQREEGVFLLSSNQGQCSKMYLLK